LVGKVPNTLRKKMAFLLKEVFDYRNVEDNKKQDVVHAMYQMVRDRPQLLVDSVKTLEKKVDKLREKAVEYIR